MAEPNYKANSQEYMTPKEIYQPILNFISAVNFFVDVCCTEENIPAAFHTVKSRPDEEIWRKTCWMNPPWNETGKWLDKAFKEVKENDCEVWCCIPGDRMNNVYFNKLLSSNDNWFIAFLTGKFNFEDPSISRELNEQNAKNGGLNSPVMIMYIGSRARELAKRWHAEQPLPSIILVQPTEKGFVNV